MEKAFTAVKSFFMTVSVFVLSLGQILSPFFATMAKGGEEAFFEDWSASQTFTRDYCTEIEKEPGKDFVVLNLTDIQLDTFEPFDGSGELAEKTITKLIEENKPDLITVTGDNAWSMTTYIWTVDLIDSYGIPWAPVMGNHDGAGTPSEFWCAYQFTQAENCLFKFGPEGMGYGNYIINVTENGEIVRSLYMMDTHSDIEEDGSINGPKGGGYDHLWPEQIEWFKWASDGIAKAAGRTVPATVYFHIPVYEYKLAWDEAYDTDNMCFTGEYAENSFGENHETVCCPPGNNGFFEVAKAHGVTDIICGHDHINDSSILYNGVRLTYGLKCGSGAYWEPEMNGGTLYIISDGGAASTVHKFVDSTTL